jgi:hypothetical protein
VNDQAEHRRRAFARTRKPGVRRVAVELDRATRAASRRAEERRRGVYAGAGGAGWELRP